MASTIVGFAGSAGAADSTNSAARFYGPYGVAVDSAGNLYVADSDSNTIRKITPAGTNWVVSTIAGLAGIEGSANGTGTNAQFYYPAGVTMDSAGNLYVADQLNDTIRKLTPAGSNWVASTIAGVSGQPGTNDGARSVAKFNQPTGSRWTARATSMWPIMAMTRSGK